MLSSWSSLRISPFTSNQWVLVLVFYASSFGILTTALPSDSPAEDHTATMSTRQYDFSGTWLPAYVPQSSFLIAILLVSCSMITSTTFGYDGSMLNGLNILPSYTDYFHLTPATTGRSPHL
jgi:hypothetical protein